MESVLPVRILTKLELIRIINLNWLKIKDGFTLKTLLLDFATSLFVLAHLFLLVESEHRFIVLNFVLDITLWLYFLLLILLFCLIHLLRLILRNNPIFTLLPGLAISLYLLQTLLQDPPVSYGIGIGISVSILIYLCLPVYKRIWQMHKKQSKICIVIQIAILIILFATVIYLLSNNLLILKTSSEYVDLLKRMKELAFLLMFAVMCFIIGYRFEGRFTKLCNKSIRVIAVMAFVNFCLLGCLLVARVLTLKTPTYDFGLFAQMFHYMKTTGQALTTLERNGLLSHFAVHISPIYYLLLPIYMIWPKPETLQIMQVLIVLSGLIPLIQLSRHFMLRDSYQVILSFFYLFHPGLVGSSLFDLHENCFLAPLILWLLLFLEKRLHLLICIATMLVFAVKEDAAVYVVLIGLYMLLSGKRKMTGIFMAVAGSVYFLIAVSILEANGIGAMFGRYDNLIARKAWGFAGIFITLLTNPGYFLNELLIPGKIEFLLTVISSLGFIPIMQRHTHRLILLTPLVIMNLMPTYPYQYELIYQYHYATTVLMLYVIILFLSGTDYAVVTDANLKSIQRNSSSRSSVCSVPAPASMHTGGSANGSSKAKRSCGFRISYSKISVAKPHKNLRESGMLLLLCFAVICSIFYTTKLMVGAYYPVQYLIKSSREIAEIKIELDKIPQNASIQASTMLTTYLSNRNILYDLEYNQRDKNPHETDYIVIDRRFGVDKQTEMYVKRFLLKSYAVLVDIPWKLLIIAKQEINPRQTKYNCRNLQQTDV